MSNSKLATSHYWTKNYSSRNGAKISKIIIHHMAGNLNAKQCYNVWKTRQGSAHYCIDSKGNIGQTVDEKHRAWSVANSYWDGKAVTIECANSTGSPNWKISDATMKSLIKLVADICKRNGIKKCTYTGNTEGTLLMHRWFMSTACPGPYLMKKFSYIAKEVNKILNNSNITTSKPISNKITKIDRKYKITAKEGLNIRSGPTIKHDKVGFIEYNKKVDATKKSGNWVYIPKKSGWICLKKDNETYAIEVKKASTISKKKSNETIAKEVIEGKWGNGKDREAKLKKAGYDPKKIQSIVNTLLK